MARYRYVNERSFRLLTDGIAFSQTDIHSLDEFLIGLEEKTRLISRLVDHNAKNGAKPPASQLGSGTIVVIEKTYQLPSGTPRLARLTPGTLSAGTAGLLLAEV